ncbi:hypothetical protein SAMN02799622_01845 [Methylobacterium sp. UNC378MF]|uniref:Uncharacterized protein n=1 Tax=Methylobacterium oryzae TaxID=334852 RepID=A0ABU7TMB3_9HYPH|nr:hypothetical protein [Methylobacterium sp. UNC378MF]SDA17581.1 hypothetical protein SAMN02799622_01845 [Methylobacterium sp. UNC378MF]
MTLLTDRKRWDAEALRHIAERDDPEAAWASMNVRLFAELQAAVDDNDRDALKRACRRADLRRVELSLVDGGAPDPALDAYLELILRSTPLSVYDPPEGPAPYTRSIDAARAFVAEALPGFWVSSGLCGLTGHASLWPDYNGPHGERLFREWPEDECPCEWSEDLAPGNGIGRECRAILAAAVRALSHRHELTGAARPGRDRSAA